jgi:ribosomal protein RSM22 (predicted rRNA methylase)
MEEFSKVILSHIFDKADPSLFAEREIPATKLLELARGVAQLSDVYTRHRTQLSDAMLQSAPLREAYLAYFLPVNLEKFHLILRELWMHPQVPELFKSGIRFLDLGSGPGSQLLGLLLFQKTSQSKPRLRESLAIDHVGANLEMAWQFHEFCLKKYFPSIDPVPRLKTLRADLSIPVPSLSAEGFNLICLGNLLNELFAGQPNRLEKRLEFVTAIVSAALHEDGFLILLEPALRETSRDLLLLRDQLVQKAGLHVYAPCVHERPCPAVADGCDADWCHEDRLWEPPGYLSKIDKLAGIRKTSLKYSYLVLSRRKISIRDASSVEENIGEKTESWRVVSERIEEKGKSFCFLCGERGRLRVTQLDKNGTEGNRNFEQADRGQIVITCGLHEKKLADFRVEKETLFKILIDPARLDRT